MLTSRASRRCRHIVTRLLTGPALGSLLVLAALLLAATTAARAAGRPLVPLRGPVTALWLPHLLLAVPFVAAGAPYAVWVLPVTTAVVALSLTALRHTAVTHRPTRAYGVPGPVLAVLITGTVLLHLGALLAVRLVVLPDPHAPFAAAFGGDALGAAWSALIQPALGIALVVVLLTTRRRTTTNPATRKLPGAKAAAWAAHGEHLERIHSARLTLLLLAAVALPFLLPLAGGGSPALTLGPVATPEYGKLVLLAALAFVVARDAFRFRSVSFSATVHTLRQTTGGGTWSRLRALYRAWRFAGLPLALFAVVAVTAALRRDFGTLVPAALLTAGVTWAATRRNTELDARGEGRAGFTLRLLHAYRLFMLVAVAGIVAGAALFTTDYVGERGRVWNDPWAYRWDAACAPVAVPANLPVPDGWVACRRALAADVESERSQVARSLAALADGGLWGRGLADTASAAVTAGPTDFVLAVLWNKLGGLVVAATGLLVALLAAALARAGSPPPAPESPTVLGLFAAGLGTMLAGQFLVVLAATAGIVPHTGIPAPLLSRGSQSTLALALGVILVVACARAAQRDTPHTPEPEVRPRTATLPLMLVLAVVAGAVLRPYPAPRLGSLRAPVSYGEQRPVCAGRTADTAGLTSPPPDPEACSTDLIALNRTRVELRLRGRPGFELVRADGTWRPAPGARLRGLTADDLTGLVRTGAGPAGILERSHPAVLHGSAGTTLSRRLLPVPAGGWTDGVLDVTLDPRLQHLAATALRGTSGRAAVVVLDASSGDVLAAAGADRAPAVPQRRDDERADDFGRRHFRYVRPHRHDDLDDPGCPRRSRDSSAPGDCWRWSLTRPGPQAPRGLTNDALGRRFPLRSAPEGIDWSCREPDPATAGRLAGTKGPCRAGGVGWATPLTVAAAVAGRGTVHPRLVTAVTDPATRARHVTPARPAGQPAAGTRTWTGGSGRVSWRAGRDGPIAYAVVAEAGPARVRELTATILEAIGEST
ncbi:FtsW/RodA/SpoVE family cell cycle protein [Actinoplanes sp. RD1]|uniref:FtsW/RodA/SpoVE family cell cycle protein n=1 Tax=Actinoplanes sp. RD1 TaxID=3064538 RepID=UPI00274235A1|nr:FtsW/RodA/SpoVE family cell cycle protein [Actinoplanes sp. RD1]